MNVRTGNISCVRNPGTKDVWVDVLNLSRDTKVKIYAGKENEVLGTGDFICQVSNLEDPINLGHCVAEILQTQGNETRIIVGLANWGSGNIVLEDVPLQLSYVNDHGEGFPSIKVSAFDGNTIFPGTMALFELDPKGQDEGFASVDLQGGDEILLAWGDEPSGGSSSSGDSSGCSAAGGLPLTLLFSLPLIGLAARKR